MGRRREFCVDKALDAALSVFWSKGYHGASYTDLTEATGVERPALYSAFGNKEALFHRALEYYYEHYMNFIPAALAMPTAREVAAHLFSCSAELNTRHPGQTGCLIINGALAGPDEAEPIRQALIETRVAGEAQLRERFARAKAEGDLPQTAEPAVLAAFVMAVLHGMAVQAKAGYSRDTLEAVGKQALAGWPTGNAPDPLPPEDRVPGRPRDQCGSASPR